MTSDFEFVWNQQTGRPHVEDHGVHPHEAIEVVESPDLDRAGSDGCRIAIGQTGSGRFLRVIYRRVDRLLIRIITAYDLPPKARKALRRRKRR